MSTVIPAAQPAAAPPILDAGSRFLSIDAYRGFIMIFLVSEAFGLAVLRAYPGWSWLGNQLEHAAWEGCTLWDLIQPGFTFIVGASMPFALASRMAKGAGRWELFRHVAARSFFLILLSNVLSNFDATGKPVLQLINVLCQIAFGYFICFLIIQLRFRYQVLTAALILAGYWALFVLFPGPDGPYSKTNNIGAVIDRAVLGYNYSDFYTTINFVGNAITILFGCWAGMLLQSSRPQLFKVKILAGAGIAGILLGLAFEPLNPMIKHLWTLSFTLYSGGWVVLGLLAFYWIIEVKQLRNWTFPMIVVGTNCIFIYSFWQVLSGWLSHGIGVFTGNFWFLGDLGAIPLKTLTMCAMWYLCYWLYKRRIFFRL